MIDSVLRTGRRTAADGDGRAEAGGDAGLGGHANHDAEGAPILGEETGLFLSVWGHHVSR